MPLGTAKLHENEPEPDAVIEPLAQLRIVALSNTSDPNAFDSEKPVPETVTFAPTGPWVGVSVIAGTVSVKIAEAMFVPSDATIVSAPGGTAGIVTEHEKLPDVRDEQLEPAAAPSNVNVTV